MTRFEATVCIAALSILAVACSAEQAPTGSGEPSPSAEVATASPDVVVEPTATASSPKPTRSTRPAPPAGPGTPGPDPEPKTYKKLAGGPTVRVFPPGDDAYQAIASVDRCREMMAKTTTWPRTSAEDEDVIGVPDVDFYVYQGGAAACLENWDLAGKNLNAFRALPPTAADCASDPACCARLEVAAWIDGLLKARAADPSFHPVFVDNPATSPCPTGSDSG